MYDRTYSELITLSSYEERLEYLKLHGVEHNPPPRSLAQSFYKTDRWLRIRDSIAKRDFGCDLGVFGVYIYSSLYVHHINPITKEDIENGSYKLYDPENLICCSLDTHNTIHYRKEVVPIYVERTPGDTKLW